MLTIAGTKQVCEVMSRNAPRIREETTMVEALRLLEEKDGPVIVEDEDGEVVGVIAEGDIRAFVEAMRTVTHLMNRRFTPVGEDAPVAELAEIFEDDEELSALPVYSQDGALVGAVSREQIDGRASQAPAATDTRARSSGATRRPDRPTVTSRMRRTLENFRERAAAIRKERSSR